MAQEIHYLGSAMVVLLDKAPHDDLLEAYKYVRNPASMEYDPKPYVRTIRELLPECLDDQISITPTHYFEKVFYEVNLPHGKVVTTLEFTDKLEEKIGSCFDFTNPIPDTRMENYKRQFTGKSAAILKGTYQEMNSGVKSAVFPYHADEVITDLVVNAFCRDEDIGKALKQSHYRGPLLMRGNEVRAAMKDFTLKKLQESDGPLHEFYTWMQQEMPSLNTIRELLIQAREQRKTVAERFNKLHEQGFLLPGAEICARGTASMYLTKAREIVLGQNLSPPKNNRMDYLAAD